MSLQSYMEEEEYTKSTKTEEELKKLTLEEGLTELKRSFYILTKGQQLQKWAIYSNLHHILTQQTAQERLLPIINEDIQNQTDDIQIATAKSLRKALLKHYTIQKNSEFFTQQSLQEIFYITQQMFNLWSINVLDEWLEVFQELLYIVDYEFIEPEIKKICLHLSDQSQPTESKYIACRIIGLLAIKEENKFKGKLLDRALALCNDTDQKVRYILVTEVLIQIIKNINRDYIEIFILAKSIEFAYDSDKDVRLQGITLLFSVLIEYLSPEQLQMRICKIFIDIVQTNQVHIILQISQIIGKTYQKLQTYLLKTQLMVNNMFESYFSWSKHENTQIRVNFCANIPGFLMLGDPRTKEILLEKYRYMLAKDKSEEVQMKLISQMHEIIIIFGSKELYDSFYPLIINLFKSKQENIIDKLITCFDKILNAFYKTEQFHQDDQTHSESIKSEEEAQIDTNKCMFNELIDFYDRAQQLNQNKWRQMKELIQNLGKVFSLYDEISVIDIIFPKLEYQILNGGQMIQDTVCQLIVNFLKNNFRFSKTIEYIQQTEQYYLNSKCYKERLFYLRFYQKLATIFSRQFFQQNKLYTILQLYNDPVRTVQLRFTQLIPTIRETIDDNDEANEEVLSELDKISKKLEQNADQQIRETAIQSIQLIKSTDYDDQETIKYFQNLDDKRNMHQKYLQQQEEEFIQMQFKKQKEQEEQDEEIDISDLNFISHYKKPLNMKIHKNLVHYPNIVRASQNFSLKNDGACTKMPLSSMNMNKKNSKNKPIGQELKSSNSVTMKRGSMDDKVEKQKQSKNLSQSLNMQKNSERSKSVNQTGKRILNQTGQNIVTNHNMKMVANNSTKRKPSN